MEEFDNFNDVFVIGVELSLLIEVNVRVFGIVR